MQAWVMTLLQGSGAALIGFVGAFVVFHLTRRHEHQRAEIQRRDADADRAAIARLEAVTGVSTASAFLIRDMAMAPFFSVRAVTELLAQTLKLVMVTRQSSPAVSNWAMVQYRLLTQTQVAYRRQWLRPWARRKRLDAWSHHAGQLGGKLVLWQAGDLTDEWFEKDLQRLLDKHPEVAHEAGLAGDAASTAAS